ncbi:hypothetical protein ACJX0J_028597, partial [Zea mays]
MNWQDIFALDHYLAVAGNIDTFYDWVEVEKNNSRGCLQFGVDVSCDLWMVLNFQLG